MSKLFFSFYLISTKIISLQFLEKLPEKKSYLDFIFLKEYLITYRFEAERYIIMSTVYIYFFKALVSFKLLNKYQF